MSSTPPGSPPPGDGGPPPPPPAGGGGGFSAGSGAGAGGAGGGRGDAVDLGAAFKFGWAKFQENVGPIVTGMILLFFVVGAAGAVWFLLVGGILGTGTDTGLFVGILATAIGSLVFFVGFVFIQAIFVRAGLDLVDGRGLQQSRLFRTDDLGPILVTSLLVGLGVAIGSILCYLPGLIFQFLAAFAVILVIDEGMSPTDAIRGSIDIVRANPGSAVLLVFVTGVVSGLGALLCGVGMLVTFPVALIAQAYGYRQLRGQPVPSVS